MSASERNRRVAFRHGAEDADAIPAGSPTLWVPAQAALTTTFFQTLSALDPGGDYNFVWHADHPPIEWRHSAAVVAPRRIQLAESAVLDVSTRPARRRSAWMLLNASGKPQDGWLSRHVHRKISRVFSYVFMTCGLSANVATLMTFAIGLVAAYLMAQTTHATMIAGGLLFWFASIADGIDGEVARLTLTESPFGEQLDTGVDQLTHLSGLVGVLVGWWRQGIGPSGLALAVIVTAGTPLMLLWAMTIVRRAQQADQFFVPTKPIEIALFRAAAQTGAWPLQAAAAVFVLFRREAFSCAFFVLSLVTAQRAAIPAAIGAGLAIVLVTLGAYGQTLNRALREISDPSRVDRSTARQVQGSSAPA